MDLAATIRPVDLAAAMADNSNLRTPAADSTCGWSKVAVGAQCPAGYKEVYDDAE